MEEWKNVQVEKEQRKIIRNINSVTDGYPYEYAE